MLNSKRNRSDEDEDLDMARNPNSEEFKEVQKTVFGVDHTNKLFCQFCKKDITKSVKIACAICPKTIYCIECLVSSKGIDDKTQHKHDYYIIDKLSMSFFTSDWTANEEILLIIGVEKYGLDNWHDISEFIGSKSKLQCEAHYYSFYLNKKSDIPEEKDIILKKKTVIDKVKDTENKERYDTILNEVKKRQGVIQEICNKEGRFNSSRSIIKNRNRKDQNANINTTANEIIGYWPKREDFDIEYLNDAELEIAEIEFQDDNTQTEKDLKLNMLKVYNSELDEREKRKRLQKDDREIYNCIKPFARFLSKEQFQEFFEGLVLEKNLKLRVNQLKAYKKNGLKTYEDIEKHLEMDNTKSKKENKKSLMLFENTGIGSKVAKYLRHNNPEFEISNSMPDKEKNFIKQIGVKKEIYGDVKTRILKDLATYNPKDIENINNLKASISKNITQYFDIDKDRLNRILEFVLKINEESSK